MASVVIGKLSMGGAGSMGHGPLSRDGVGLDCDATCKFDRLET